MEDSGLGTLGDYGGPTQTIPLLPGSPAIDAGSNELALSGMITDQRGSERIENGTVDIGAYEVGPPTVVTVTTAMDVVDANDGATSLREAIAYANENATEDTITFDPSLAWRTIRLMSGELTITDPTRMTTIAGLGAYQLTVSGNDTSRVFHIASGATVHISGLTITQGRALDTGQGDLDGSSGGISNEGTLALADCTVCENTAAYDGGGIGNGGVLTIVGSTLSENSAAQYGGGIANTGTLTIANSTLSENSATGGGGGIADGGTSSITNCTLFGNSAYLGGGVLTVGMSTITGCTLAQNSATGGGSGIYNYEDSATIILNNTMVADNHGNTSSPDIYGTAMAECSLIGDNTGSDLAEAPVGAPDANGNLIGGPIHGIIDPMLRELSDNGGPTQTLALLPGSPAIDVGSNALIPTGVTTDQRGYARIVSGTVDMGAYEFPGDDATPPTLTIGFPVDGAVYGLTSWTDLLEGTATDTGGAGPWKIEVSVRQATGNYWDGDGFDSESEVFLVAEGTESWTVDFLNDNFPSDGEYTVHARATDLAGNVETSPTATFTYDATPPVSTIGFPEDGAVYGPASWDMLEGAAADTGGAGVALVEVSIKRVSDDLYWGGSVFDQAEEYLVAADGTTDWSLNFPANNLTDGVSYTVHARATDEAGNVEASPTATFTYDTTPPMVAVKILDDSLNDADNSSEVTFTFTEPPLEFEMEDLSADGGTLSGFSGSGTSYAVTFTADDGLTTTGSVSVAAGSYTDAAGNPGSAGSDTVAIDTSPPAVALSNTTTTLPESTDTSSRIKVADVEVSDDALGANVLSLDGLDAVMFEVEPTSGTGGFAASLYLKAGALLDYESNPVLDVTVAVDDATVGATPDASTTLSITVTDVQETLLLEVADDSVSEAAGAGATTVTVTRNADLASELVVTITNPDNTELYLPTTITIPAGQPSAQFEIETVNDGDLDGDQVGLAISSSAAGYVSGSHTITVTDDDTPSDHTLGGHLYGPLSAETYRVLFDISVDSGATLTIAPGSTLKFNLDVAMNINGALVADAETGSEIVFTSVNDTPAPDDWEGISIARSSMRSTLDHVEIAYATKGISTPGKVTLSNSDLHHNSYGIYSFASAGTSISSTDFQILDNRIHDNTIYGVFLGASTHIRIDGNNNGSNFAQVSGNEIDHNSTGILLAASTISVYNYPSSAGTVGSPISNNYIHHNTNGISTSAYAYSNHRAYISATITNNLIVANGSYGLYLNSSSVAGAYLRPTVINNTIVNNSDAGIWHASTDAGFALRNNIVVGGSYGIEADTTYAPAAGTVDHNLLYGNTLAMFGNYPTEYGSPTTTNANGTPSDAEMNITVDPLFQGASDFHLRLSSLAIDAGATDDSPATDYDGDSRVAPIDIGSDEVLASWDFGDAPAPYPTVRSNAGARHAVIAGGPILGTEIDAEGDGQPDDLAAGDDNADGDDEDGVAIPTLAPGAPALITVEVNGGGGVLDAWIDFGQDGQFDPADRIYGGALADGVHQIAVNVPPTAQPGTTYARFRVSTQGGLEPGGRRATMARSRIIC